MSRKLITSFSNGISYRSQSSRGFKIPYHAVLECSWERGKLNWSQGCLCEQLILAESRLDHALHFLFIWLWWFSSWSKLEWNLDKARKIPFLKPNVVLSPSTGGKLGAVVHQQGSSCIVNCDLEYCQEDSIAESGWPGRCVGSRVALWKQWGQPSHEPPQNFCSGKMDVKSQKKWAMILWKPGFL